MANEIELKLNLSHVSRHLHDIIQDYQFKNYGNKPVCIYVSIRAMYVLGLELKNAVLKNITVSPTAADFDFYGVKIEEVRYFKDEQILIADQALQQGILKAKEFCVLDSGVIATGKRYVIHVNHPLPLRAPQSVYPCGKNYDEYLIELSPSSEDRIIWTIDDIKKQ